MRTHYDYLAPQRQHADRQQRDIATLGSRAGRKLIATWYVIAWNRAVAVMLLTDYGAMPPEEIYPRKG